ncbi:hypothetical protein E3N88_33833 [Mikania micrantha]|uniref:Signal recognition particle 9 kDa protein n=1 Tax=Mikania micrantha TaxID=192012 RepID=A0A5N6MCY7_9ASTR|nr:hypothetical protein E3N88_33827 [Mikania micrantha]KAD3338312.1 hypothetical protein E3N88_33833 [Mikania micrantha]
MMYQSRGLAAATLVTYLIAADKRSGSRSGFEIEGAKAAANLSSKIRQIRCLKFKTDQAQDAKKMEKLNNIFFTLMARGPETDITEVTGKEQTAQPAKRGRGRKQ